MKIKRVETLIDTGDFSNTEEYKIIEKNVYDAIYSIENPPGSGKFILNNGKKANGVKTIKDNFIKKLDELNWFNEKVVKDSNIKKRKIDTSYKVPQSNLYFGVEWETGNISSSHRAINRLILGILEGDLIGGFLVLPSRDMYNYLTDRIGNFQELEPYFKVWKLHSNNIPNCVLKVIEIEHDEISDDIPPLKKGTDGRAKI